jgi:hypothetical protein
MASMNLATALAIFGFAVLGLLALQLWWATKRKQRSLRVERGTPPAERVEPAMGGDGLEAAGSAEGQAAAEAAHGAELSELSELSELGGAVGLDETPTVPGELPRPRVASRRLAKLDPLIDAIVPLVLEAPISGELALAHVPPTRRAGSKAFYIEGLGAETGEWEALAPGRRYSELQAGVQMASRSGALNEIEFSEFMQKVNAFAEAVGAAVDGAGAPDMLHEVARARELDGHAAPLDAQLTVTLRTNSVAWSVSFVQQVASKLGFVPGVVPGRLVLPSEEPGAPPILVLSVDSQAALSDDPQASAIRECTLALDVPQTPAAKEPFPAWHLAARKLADDLDATLGDDQGQPITLQAFSEIGNELDGLYARLEAVGLPAGSAAARRVFS